MSLKTAVYARISQDHTGEALGVERQLSDCRSLCASRGWEVVAEYVDNNLSAYRGKRRPDYAALLEDMRAGNIEAVVAWHPDRLTRNPRELEDILDAVETHKLTVATVQAGDVDLSTPSGRAVARTLVAWAKHESEHKASRQKRAALQMAEDGKRNGYVPYGWRSESEAETVRRIVSGLLAGDSIRSLAQEFNDKGIPAPRASEWSNTAIRQLALRWSNAGKRTHKGVVVADGDWEPLVSEAQQESVIRLLRDPKRKTTSGNVRKHLLSGYLVCGRCGKTMRWSIKNRQTEVYRCDTPHLSIAADLTERYVLAAAQERLRAPDAAGLSSPTQDGSERLRERLVALRGRLDGLAEDYAAGVLDREQVKAAGDKLRADIALIESELRTIEAKSSRLLDTNDIYSLSPDRQRAVLEVLMTVTILPIDKTASRRWDASRIHISWNED